MIMRRISSIVKQNNGFIRNYKDKYNVTDLIIHAADQKPSEFEATFDSLLKDRLVSAVENRKQEIAQAMFNIPVADESEE